MYKTYPVFFAAFLLLLTSVAHSSQQKKEEEQRGTIVAKVNDVPIYEKELNESLALRFNKQKKYGMQTDHMQPNVAYAIKMQVLDELIDGAVIYQATMATEGLPDVEEQVNQKILSLASTFGSEKKYGEFLNTKDTSLEKKRAYYRKTYLVQAYFDKKGLTKPEIPEDDIKALYEQQKNSFRVPEQVKFSQIFIKVDKDASPEDREKAKKTAQEAKKLLQDGKSFDEVTRVLSEKTGLEISGGDRGYMGKGVLPHEVEDVAFSIMPWKISDVIESKFGYHVLMIADKKPAEFTPYEKVRDFLLRYLETEAVRKNVAKHTRELREKAKIEVFLKKGENADKKTSS